MKIIFFVQRLAVTSKNYLYRLFLIATVNLEDFFLHIHEGNYLKRLSLHKQLALLNTDYYVIINSI